MKVKQVLLLFLALLLPVCIFLFLKGFGENQFNVPPLFTDQLPTGASTCPDTPSLPYHIPDSSLTALGLVQDSIAFIHFTTGQALPGLPRVKDVYGSFPLKFLSADAHRERATMQCIYFLQEPFDAVVVDKKGRIRGQYDMKDRDEVDRLITELAIIFKKY